MKKIYLLASALAFATSFNAQVHYSENFESGNGTSWTYTDLDGDGKNFRIASAASLYSGIGSKSLVSFSWENQVLTPNNLVSSTPITLPSGMSNLFLKYNVASQAESYGAEHYAVYITPTNNPTDILASTPVLVETLPFEGGMFDRTVNVSAFAGQTVYLSFRHFDTEDQYILILDNLSIETLASTDARLMSAKIPKYIAANTNTNIKYNVRNNGGVPITSVELNWNDGSGDHKSTVSTNIAPGSIVEVTHPTPVNYTTLSDKTINASVTLVNGMPDSSPSNNSATITTSVASQVFAKKVVIEEGTGTWCGWCTRGIVALDVLAEQYPNDQISIAVHGGSASEPMRVAAYDTFSSFPGMNVDRELKGVSIGPDTIGSYVENRKTIGAPVELTGEYSINGDQLTATVNSKFFINKENANYKLAVVLVEDNVTGTTSGYRQYNYYSGGGNGPMGGFENKPNPIPAADMVYNHVGRALLGGYNGQDGSVPATVTDGMTASYTFNYTIPATQKANDLHAVFLLLDGSNGGAIVNGAKLSKTLAVNDVDQISANTKIYPNPAKSDFNISLVKDGKYTISIYDMAGREVVNYGEVTSAGKKINLPIKLTTGKYLVNIVQDGVSMSKSLIVK